MIEPKKIKVVFGVNDFSVGGMQRQFSEQIRFFDRQKFDISLITLFYFPEKEYLYTTLPSDLPVYKLSFRGWWDVRAWATLCRLLRTLRPRIVVSSLFFSNTVFRALRPFFGYTAIAREHNTYIGKPWLQRSIDLLFSKLSYCIVAVSTTVADFTAKQEHIPRGKFQVIHNGRDITAIEGELEALPGKSELRDELGIARDALVFVNVSRLTPQKNHHLLIEGFAEFIQQHPRAVLAIVGMGDMQNELEAQAQKLGVGEKIIFFGHHEETTKFYKIADFFISASDMEGFSNSVIKALVAGLPIVSTLTAGTDEFLEEGKNGFVIRSATKGEVAGACARAVAGSWEALSASARESASRFSIEETVHAYERLFERVVRTH